MELWYVDRWEASADPNDQSEKHQPDRGIETHGLLTPFLEDPPIGYSTRACGCLQSESDRPVCRLMPEGVERTDRLVLRPDAPRTPGKRLETAIPGDRNSETLSVESV